MYNVSDLRKGLKIEMEGVPYLVTEFNFVKPGKGQALYVCKLKNMLTGGTVAKTFRASDTIAQPEIEKRDLTYSYKDGDNYVFLDPNFEQVVITPDGIGDALRFLAEGIEVAMVFYKGRPIEVTLPTFVTKEVVETEPGSRGDTVSAAFKLAKVEGGHELQVPLFINVGDALKIDTRTGEYVDRISKK